SLPAPRDALRKTAGKGKISSGGRATPFSCKVAGGCEFSAKRTVAPPAISPDMCDVSHSRVIRPSAFGGTADANLACIPGMESSRLRIVRGVAVLFFTVKGWAIFDPW